MNMNMFNGMFGKIAPGMCRLAMNGKIAIKTSNGYKSYDVNTGKLTNCNNFALDIGEDFFFVIPTNSVKRGDIILADNKPRMVLEVNSNEIKTFCYEDSTISTIVPERHMFMGNTYFYGKIVSMFGNSFGTKKGAKKMFKYMMLSEMMNGHSTASNVNNTMSMMPMMFMMNGGMDDIFDFDDMDVDFNMDENEEDIEEEEN